MNNAKHHRQMECSGMSVRVNSVLIFLILEVNKVARTNRSEDDSLRLACDDESDSFIVRYANMGEPFREGVSIGIANEDFSKDVQVMLEKSEAKQLRDLLVRLYPL